MCRGFQYEGSTNYDSENEENITIPKYNFQREHNSLDGKNLMSDSHQIHYHQTIIMHFALKRDCINIKANHIEKKIRQQKHIYSQQRIPSKRDFKLLQRRT